MTTKGIDDDARKHYMETQYKISRSILRQTSYFPNSYKKHPRKSEQNDKKLCTPFLMENQSII